MRILVASNNPKKRRELARILSGLPGLELSTPRDLGLELVPEETGSTFAENARIKALAFSRLVDDLVLGDDSGLEVDALGGRPGVQSARFAGPDADDAANRGRLLEELAGVPPERRTARFVCVVVLARRGHVLAEERGEVEGRIIENERGGRGFGYDPLFLVPGEGRTFAEIDDARKDALSHRGRALGRLRPYLEALAP